MLFNFQKYFLLICLFVFTISCKNAHKKDDEKKEKTAKNITAKDILGNPDYVAISYGGYRAKSRDMHPTIPELKEDMKLLSAMGIKILRTYNVQTKFPHAANVLEAIHQLKKEDANFEMYVMLGAWIDCLNAWTDKEKNHAIESEANEGEIARAVALTNKYPDIVKIIAVGNEAMVKWAESYFVQPNIILKWVNHLQNLKKNGALSKDVWITSSDDFASWGGGNPIYHTKDLDSLIKAVDYVSAHTYAYHNSHHNSAFWKIPENEQQLSDKEKIDNAMLRALAFAKMQYKNVVEYVKKVDTTKVIHIGETGWSTISNGYYGKNGSRVSDEYKQGLYYKYLREWTNKENISCFYFEAFDEPWKDASNKGGSENHFGLFTVDAKAKYVLWDMLDKGNFKDLQRGKNNIIKTYNGSADSLMKDIKLPAVKDSLILQNDIIK